MLTPTLSVCATPSALISLPPLIHLSVFPFLPFYAFTHPEGLMDRDKCFFDTLVWILFCYLHIVKSLKRDSYETAQPEAQEELSLRERVNRKIVNVHLF